MHRKRIPLRFQIATGPVSTTAPSTEESLVSDARAGLSPAQQVERKLVSLLKSTPLPVSRLQSTGPRRSLS